MPCTNLSSRCCSKVIQKRAELNRITFDNKLLLNRILDVPSVINFKDDHFVISNRRHKQLREETTYYRQKHSPFPIAEVVKKPRASSVAGRSRSEVHSAANGRPDSAPANMPTQLPPHLQPQVVSSVRPSAYLTRLRPEHLETVLKLKRPPELVSTTFHTHTALPFTLHALFYNNRCEFRLTTLLFAGEASVFSINDISLAI